MDTRHGWAGHCQGPQRLQGLQGDNPQDIKKEIQHHVLGAKSKLLESDLMVYSYTFKHSKTLGKGFSPDSYHSKALGRAT